jgi:quercetin dioxygenase-like cupin family protein
MSYKIVRANEATVYEAPGHFGVVPTRLHNPQDVNDGKLICGLSHFEVGGGCEFGANPLESIYYIIAGQMEVTDEDGVKTTMMAGDTFHCGPMTKKGILNNGTSVCDMLVCLLPPQA